MSRQSNLLTVVHTFLQFQNDIKIYHWQTSSYSRHKSSDKLYESLLNLIDDFVETFMGQLDTRIKIYSARDTRSTIKLRNISDKQAVTLTKKFRVFLQNLEKLVPDMTTDLLNIRDELLALVDKTMYLFTLR